MAEAGHEVTIITQLAMVGKELERTSADGPLRQRLKEQGTVLKTECAVKEWHGDGVTVVDLLSGAEEHVAADALVTATPNVVNLMAQDEIDMATMSAHQIGGCVAPRTAIMAIYEGRKLGLEL